MRHFLAVRSGWEAVAFGAEVRGDGAMRGEKALRVSWGREPLQAPLPLTGRLVGILGAIVQGALLQKLAVIWYKDQFAVDPDHWRPVP